MGGKRVWDWVQLSTTNYWISHACMVKPPQNPEGQGLKSSPGWWTRGGGALREHGHSASLAHALVYASPLSGYPWDPSYHKPVIYSAKFSLSSARGSSYLVDPEEGSWEPLIYMAGRSKAQATTGAQILAIVTLAIQLVSQNCLTVLENPTQEVESESLSSLLVQRY